MAINKFVAIRISILPAILIAGVTSSYAQSQKPGDNLRTWADCNKLSSEFIKNQLQPAHRALLACMNKPVKFGEWVDCKGRVVRTAYAECSTQKQRVCDLENRKDERIGSCQTEARLSDEIRKKAQKSRTDSEPAMAESQKRFSDELTRISAFTNDALAASDGTFFKHLPHFSSAFDALSGVLNTKSALEKASKRQNIQQAFEDIYETYGDEGLALKTAKIRDATHALIREERQLQDLAPPELSLNAAPISENLRRFFKQGDQIIPRLEAIQSSYMDRASHLRRQAALAISNAKIANAAYNFLTSEEGLTLAFVSGGGVAGSAVAGGFIANSNQFRTLENQLTGFAKAANELAMRYEINVERSADYIAYLNR